MNPLIHDIFQVARHLNKELNHALKEHDLYASQWTVLYCLHNRGDMSLTDIWKYLHVEAPTITRTINRLEELGWVNTYPGKDRREKIVTLTEDATSKLPNIKATIEQFERFVTSGLSEEEQHLLMSLLQKMTAKGSN